MRGGGRRRSDGEGAGIVSGWMLLKGWALLAAGMGLLWELARRRGIAGVVDVAWSLGTALLGVLFALFAGGYVVRRALVAALAAIWGLRLAGHLTRRLAREGEDGRYRDLRRRWGGRTWLYLFGFFQLQAFWGLLFSLPILAAASNPVRPLGGLDLLGVLTWTVGVVGESVADAQLDRFRSDPDHRGEVCRVGLWRYSRHPNYFFEWIHWWGYAFLAAGGPYGWVAVLGPVILLVFLFWVTGIPPTEARALRSRGEAYRRYQETTSVFVPLPPRTEEEAS